MSMPFYVPPEQFMKALAPKIGYDNASMIAKKAHKNGTSLKEEALKSGLVNEKEYNRLINPRKMTHPN